MDNTTIPAGNPTPDLKSTYFWEGEKIRLRAYQEKDGAAWLEDNLDSESRRTLNPGIELPKTEAAAAELFKKFGDFRSQNERIFFTIETLAGEIVGGININSINTTHGTFCVGGLIHRKHRGHGYYEEAKRLVFRYCFHELRLNKYNAGLIETNQGMIRHVTRMGCQPEGRRSQMFYTNGRYYDEILFGLTREQFDAWEAARSNTRPISVDEQGSE
ncbi:MAG: GNAT family protein [Verrucomicrobiota bacterium]|nr:GNAT family protein [Verrucomicrobiota bacterium]